MAAPAETTIQNLDGQYVMNRALSDDPDPILALQGVSWMTRTALAYATVTLSITEYIAPNTDDETQQTPITKIDISQTATGGIQSSEKRTTDWRVRAHEDRIFGSLSGQSRFVRGATKDGKVRPALEVQTQCKDQEKVARFLRGEILPDGSEVEGFVVDAVQDKEGVSYGEGEGLWLQSWVRNEEYGWSAEQIWGFEIIDGQRYYTRRVAVAKGDQYILARLVYDYQGPVA